MFSYNYSVLPVITRLNSVCCVALLNKLMSKVLYLAVKNNLKKIP